MAMALPRPYEKPEDSPDARLVAEPARGSPDALAALYSRYAKELLALAYRLLQSRQDAEDVVHDVFVGLPEALRRYEERGSLGPWLRKITARVALMRLREQRARPVVELDERRARASTDGPETALTIEQALRALSPNLRAVLVLKEIEGFTHAEIATMLDISVGASEVRLHRALIAMRATLLDNT
jgi:RNA polymerase sigma-70 factor (ECF subfamily)